MYYQRKALAHCIMRLLGMRTYPRRYEQILAEIDHVKPKTILEIGTNDGLNAVRMFDRASRHREDVEYFGFDLFENMSRSTFLHEFSLTVPAQDKVSAYMRAHGVTRQTLFTGNTVESMKSAKLPKIDLAFIDGGHSQETVAADWRNLQKFLHSDSVVYFDDYPNWGIRPVVDSIDRKAWDVRILPVVDIFPVNRKFDPNSKESHMRFQFVRVAKQQQ